MKFILNPAQSFSFWLDGQWKAARTGTRSPLGQIPRTQGFECQAEFLAPPQAPVSLILLLILFTLNFLSPDRPNDRKKLSKCESAVSHGAFCCWGRPLSATPPLPVAWAAFAFCHLPILRGGAGAGRLHTSSPRWGTAQLPMAPSGHISGQFHVYSINYSKVTLSTCSEISSGPECCRDQKG